MAYFNLSLIDPQKHSSIREHLLWDFNREQFDYQKGKSIVVERVPRAGYMNISPTAILNDDLLQEVAGFGMEVSQDKYFPDLLRDN